MYNENIIYTKEEILIFKRMQKEYYKLESQISKISEEIEKLPAGKLVCSKNGRYIQWFQSDGHIKKYIRKKNRALLEKLAIKKFLNYHLEDLVNEKRAIEYYLRHHREDVGKAESLLSMNSEYRELLSPYFKTKSKVVQEWLQEPFEQNTQFNENLKLKSMSGNIVRSKSEVMIDTLLHVNKIPFRYECALKLGRKKIYPDFTIMHPKTGKIIYWEHFGKMTDEDYIKKTCAKIQLYSMHGIIPEINLIMTFETPEHPLSTEEVMEKLQKYFDVETSSEMLKMQFS